MMGIRESDHGYATHRERLFPKFNPRWLPEIGQVLTLMKGDSPPLHDHVGQTVTVIARRGFGKVQVRFLDGLDLSVPIAWLTSRQK